MIKTKALNRTLSLILNVLKNKKVRGLLQIIVSFSLLAYFLSSVGWRNVVTSFAEMNAAWYLLAFLLFELNMLIRAYRWFILLHSLNDRPSFAHLLYLYYLGFFANNFIPSGFGGDIVKVVNLRQRYGRGAEALSSVVMDRLTGLLGSSIIALIALALNSLGHTTEIELPVALWVVVAVISVGVPLAFFIMRTVDVLKILEKYVPSVQRLPKYNSFENLVDTVNRYPLPALIKSLLISLPFTINLVLIQYFIAQALGLDLPITLFSLFVPLISTVNLLPISFNGLGTREGIYLLLFVPAGVSEESAIAMSLAYFFLRFATGLIGGLILAIRSVRHLADTPTPPNNLKNDHLI